MADVDIQDGISKLEGDGNIISLQLESPPSLSLHEMRLADLRRFQIKPVPGIPLNQQAPGVYLHPTEPDTIVTISAASEPASPYMDALASEEAAIEVEMANYDETTRKAIDEAVMEYNENLFLVDAFPSSNTANRWITNALQDASTEPPDAQILKLMQRSGFLSLERWKNELRPLVVDKYHFSPQADQAVQSVVVTNLLQDSTFLQKDEDKFQAPIVKDALDMLQNKLWSNSRFGVTSTTNAIALVATVLECCLNEWKSGRRIDLGFNTDSYKDRYNEHLQNIRRLGGGYGS
ncbi:hypothetical protein C8J56DRAFT_165097 [Mycena floridula]|nr:hypothetical protein C8J56DRAFT_165097 [Mycena floridula]